MNIKQLLTDDSAVSPVIGVILMVAITVILAAVIGSFVLNLGGSLQQNAPQASFGFDYETTTDMNTNDSVVISHETGDTIESARLSVTTAPSIDNLTAESSWGGTVGAGDTANYTFQGNWNSQTVRVVWTSETGENSATLASSTAPS